MKRVTSGQPAKVRSTSTRKLPVTCAHGVSSINNNNHVAISKPKPTSTVVKTTATKRDALNLKINRAADRAVLHVFRQAFLALDVVQTVHALGSTVTWCTTDQTRNNHPASLFLALTTYTMPLEDITGSLRQVVSFESAAHSRRVNPSTEVTSRMTLKFSGWRLVDTTTDGTALCVYQYTHYDAVAGGSRSCWPSLVAVVWKDGLQVHSLYAIHSIPLVASALLSRVVTTLQDDIDPCFGLHGYTVAVSLRSFDQVVWDYEGYLVDFSSDLPIGATETVASLLVPQVSCSPSSHFLDSY
ncbi:hypothetical protein, variant [Aphanomyces astaci]|uniref:Uncharacterized protein n=1 Tax=Aphanomyces astaci TaxID=112090 RepID=W4FNT6_APHAT|nr:hypothetical protein, variant [Aphanomyces astaci]ETV68591.1 hypothetical protein, variant [Aphanomyces astaci]|eukprot:XP_009842020.1 hypothetical protein, variant [Aphanomyces astaci]